MIRFTKDESQPDWHGYFYTALFFINALVLSLFLHQYFHRVNVVGMRIRTAVIAAVYNKVCTDSCYHSRMRYLYSTYPRKHNSFIAKYFSKYVGSCDSSRGDRGVLLTDK